MKLTVDVNDKLVDLYGRTFFGAHSTILDSVYNKLEELQQYVIRKYFSELNIEEIYNNYNSENAPLKALEELNNEDYKKLYFFSIKGNYTTDRFTNVNNFLKQYSPEELNNLVFEYNKDNPNNEIALELDKDYRPFNEHCAVNEVLREYALLSTNKEALRKYIKNQLLLYIDDLKNYGTYIKIFDRKADLDKWVTEDLPDYKTNTILRVLSNEKILDKKDRKEYVQKWVNNSGELIINIGEEVNPFFEKFFYIEGLYSNNMRLLLSGSEINHPDKSNSLFKDIVKLSKDYEKGNISYIEYYNSLLANKVINKVLPKRIYDPETRTMKISIYEGIR